MAMASDGGELLLVHQIPMEMAASHDVRPANLLPPLSPQTQAPPAPPPYRAPPRLPSATSSSSAESKVSYRGWLGSPRHWDLWVAKLHLIHGRLWRDLGILDGVLASTFRYKRDPSLVLHLAAFWSPRTSSFAFLWGEATVTLHDVAVLAGVPVDGAPAPAPLPPEWRADEAALNAIRLGFNRSACKKAHHSAWIKHFLTDAAAAADADPVLEHAAFLALWLTRFVLSGHPESTMRQSLFPLAVRMARGERVALAPAVLASLYRDLRDIKAYLLSAVTKNASGEALAPLPVYAPLHLVQLWAWERFPALRPAKDNPIKEGEPRAARWHDLGVKYNSAMILDALLSGRRGFVWQPYISSSSSSTLQPSGGWVRGSHVSGNDELRSLAYCLRPSELVGMDCIEQYLPHRVAMQFGLDQDLPGDVQRANQDWLVAWATYDLEGKNVAFFIPQSQSQPGVTARYARWLKKPVPFADLNVGTVSIAVEPKAPKRKVKKTLVAMEAEEEKERKMKKPRISPNDKKRKLQELYDPKLSEWLADARSGIGAGCNKGSSPKSDTGLEQALLANAETSTNDIVLLVPRKQTTAPAVVLKKDNNLNPATGDTIKEKGVMLKAYETCGVDHPTNQPYCMETNAASSTGIPKFTEDAQSEWSGMGMKNTNELVRGGTSTDVSDRPETEEVKPPEPIEKEESSDHPSDVGCNVAAREEAVTVDNPPDAPIDPQGGGVTAMLEETVLNVPVDKSLDATDRPEILELEKEPDLSVDESCRVSNSPEEVSATIIVEKEENTAIEEADEGNAASEDAGRAASGATGSTELVPQSKQEVDAGVMNIPHDAITLPDEVLPVQQVEHVVECVEMPCTMESINASAGVLGTNDKESTCHDFVTEERRKVFCVEEIGGESNQMAENNSKQEPHEAPQIHIVEHGKDIILMEKDSEAEHSKVPQPVEDDIADNNRAGVILGVPKEENTDLDKALSVAKKETEDMSKEIVEAEGTDQDLISTLRKEVTEEHHKVAEVDPVDMEEVLKMHSQCGTNKPEEVVESEHINMAEVLKMHAQCGTDKPEEIVEEEHIDMAEPKMHAQCDTEKPEEVAEAEHIDMEEPKKLAQCDNEKPEEVAEAERIGMAEPKMHAQCDTEKPEEAAEVEHIDMAEAKMHVQCDTEKPVEVAEVEHIDMAEAKMHAQCDTEKPEEVSEIEHIDMAESKMHAQCDTEKPEVIAEVDDIDMAEPKMYTQCDTEKTEEVAEVVHAEIDGTKKLTGGDTDGVLGIPETENAHGDKTLNLANKDTQDMPNEAVEIEATEKEHITTLAIGGAEEHKEVAEVQHIDMSEPNMHAQFGTEKPEEVAEVGHAEIDGTDQKPVDIPDVGCSEVDKARGLMDNDTDEKLAEISEVENADVDLIKKDTDMKFGVVTELETTGMVGTHGPMEKNTDGNLKEVPDVNAEVEQANELGRDNYSLEGILHVDLPARDETGWLAKVDAEDNTTKVPEVEHEKLGIEAPIEEDTMEKPNTDGNDIHDKEVNESKEIFQVKQAEWEDLKVSREKDTEQSSKDALGEEQAEGQSEGHCIEEITLVEQADGQSERLTRTRVEENPQEITQAHEKEFDKDMMEASKNSINCEMLCSSASMELKGEQKEVSDEGMMDNQCIQDGEFINERESSDAINLKVGVDDHKTLDMHEEVAREQIDDCGIIRENKNMQILQDGCMLDSELKSDLVIMEIDDALASGAIQNQETLDLDKQQDMEEVAREQIHDGSIICENKNRQMLQDENMQNIELKSDLVIWEINETQATGGIQNQETLDIDKLQDMKEIHDLGATIENKKMTEEDANMLDCGEFQTDSPGTEVDEVDSTKGMQDHKHLDSKDEHVAYTRLQSEITDGNERTLEEACALGGGGVDNIVIDLDVSEANSMKGMQNQEACSMEEPREDKQQHGAENVNKNRILEDSSTIDSDDSTNAGVNRAEPREETRNLYALSMETEQAIQKRQDQGMADEHTKEILVSTDALECGGVKPDTMKMTDETLPTVQIVKIAEDTISSKNQKTGGPWEDHNKSVVEGSESYQTAMESERALLPELESQVDVKEEKMENKIEMSIGRESDEASEQDQTSTEDAIIAPSGLDDQSEHNKEWTEETIQNYGRYACDPVNTACQPSKNGRSSAEEARRIHNSRSIYLRDTKESQGRVRSTTSNGIQTNNVGYYSRHAIQEPVSVSKDIKVPLHDSTSVSARDRAPELVMTGPPEETSRWRQEQYALQILEDVQNARVAEKTRMEMEIRILKAQISSMQRQVMNLDRAGDVISRSKRH